MVIEFEFKGIKFKVTPEGTYDKSIWVYRPDHDAFYTGDGKMIPTQFLSFWKHEINHIATKLVEDWRREQAKKALDSKASLRELPESEIIINGT